MAQITKTCPNCGSAISFEANALHATCGSCDQSFKATELMNPGASAADNAIVEMANMFANFDSPESGLVYLESVFANYDWEAYYDKPVVIIDKVQQMIDKNNVKAGAVASTWYLDFVSLATPLTKKFEGLEVIAERIASKYDPKDASLALDDFGKYKAVVKVLVAGKDALLKRLENDVEFASKLSLDAAKLKEMKDKIKAVKALYDTLPATAEEVEDLELRGVPAVVKALDKVDAACAAEYTAKGIDAPSVYAEAVNSFKASGSNKNAALSMFESIKYYKDSTNYIEKINKWFNFNGEFYNFVGKNFIFKLRQAEQEGEEGINPGAKDKKSAKKGSAKGKGKGEEAEVYTGDTHELYEIVDNKPLPEPMVTKITQILTVYANKLFYIKNANVIAAFDFETKMETEIYTAKKGDFGLDGNFFFNKGESKLFIVHKMKEEKVGCFKKLINKIKALFKKKKEVQEIKNSLAVVEINLADNQVKEIIEAAYDLYANDYGYTVSGNYIFYLVAEDLDKKDLLHKKSVRSYNIETGEKKVVLDDAYTVNRVVNTKVVYSVLFPNRYNKQLRVHDIETGEDILVENNIYNFYDIYGGKIFYTVGNKKFAPLYSNNFEGTDRVEVMRNCKNILGVVGNWIYVEKYSSFYDKYVVIKLSLDGTKTIVLCADYKSSVKITDEFFYYIDVNGNLCVVNGNGGGYSVIAEQISKDNIILDDKRGKIFYLRKEVVGAKQGGVINTARRNYSLYVMDVDGGKARKVLFDVTAMKNYDGDTLYIKRNERSAFLLEKPGEITKKKKKDEAPEITVRDLVRFYKLDKATLATSIELTLGLPGEAKYEVKAGCGKKAEKDVQFVELPRIPDFIENEVEFDEDEDPYIAKDAPVAEEKGGVLSKITGKVKGIFKKK